MNFNLLKTRAGRALSGAAAVGSVAAIVVASTVMPAAAAPTPGTLIANAVTSPVGFLWLPGNLGGHWWIGDHAQGLCRVDGAPGSATLTNCDLTAKAVGQPAYDPTTHSVYVPDLSAKSQGVFRLTFDPATETMGGGGGGGVFGGGSSTAPVLLAPNKGFGGNRPFAVAVDPNDPNHALYIGFRKTPTITRVSKPSVGDGTGGSIDSIGNSSDGRQVRSMTMLTHVTKAATATTPAVAVSALAVMDGNGVGFIGNPASCTGGCKANVPASLANLLPLGVGSDNNVNAGAEASIAYIADTTGVLYAYDAVKDTLTTLSTGLSFPTAAGVKPGAAQVVVGDDPSQGNLIAQGHMYSIP